MTLDLIGKKVIVINKEHSICRAESPTAAVQWSNANLTLAPSDGPQILLVIQLDDAKTSRFKNSLE